MKQDYPRSLSTSADESGAKVINGANAAAGDLRRATWSRTRRFHSLTCFQPQRVFLTVLTELRAFLPLNGSTRTLFSRRHTLRSRKDAIFETPHPPEQHKLFMMAEGGNGSVYSAAQVLEVRDFDGMEMDE